MLSERRAARHHADVRLLQADGFVHIPGVLAPDEVASLDDRVTKLFESGRPKSRQVLYVDGHVPVDTPGLDALLHQWLNPHRFDENEGTAGLLEGPRRVARDLLGVEPVLFQDLLLVKEPGQARFPWHQDFPFWPVDKPHAVVCWLPLVQSDLDGGGLRFARASHCLGPQPAVDLHRGTPQACACSLPDIGDAYDIVCPLLAPGDAVFFTPLTFHSSAQRTKPGRRAAWSSIWLHPSVRWSHARAPAHPLCRVVEDGALVHPLT